MTFLRSGLVKIGLCAAALIAVVGVAAGVNALEPEKTKQTPSMPPGLTSLRGNKPNPPKTNTPPPAKPAPEQPAHKAEPKPESKAEAKKPEPKAEAEEEHSEEHEAAPAASISSSKRADP